MMRYFYLEVRGELKRLDGEPLVEPYQCPECDRIVRLGGTNLKVRFLNPPPHSDAVGVLFGPEWAASKALSRLTQSKAPFAARYVPVRGRDGEALPYDQVIVRDRVRIGRGSIRGGVECDACGGDVQLTLNPIFLTPIESDGPMIAGVLESPFICVVREDLADAIASARLEVTLVPTLFDGESLPDPGPTFPGHDWSDLKE